jgi:hypothetical protein
MWSFFFQKEKEMKRKEKKRKQSLRTCRKGFLFFAARDAKFRENNEKSF